MAADLQGLKNYKIDITLVIDATGSMSPFMNEVKEGILSVPGEIRDALEAENKHVEQMRIKVIDFGDFGYDGSDAIRQKGFFDAETEGDKIMDAINGIEYSGRGGDIPENGLEALYEAMASDWVEPKPNGRHIIVLVTDAPPLDLGERAECEGYDKDRYPETIEDLGEIWNPTDMQGGDSGLKLAPMKARLVLFAPQGVIAGHTWDDVVSWERVIFKPVESGKGVKIEMGELVAEIVHSIRLGS